MAEAATAAIEVIAAVTGATAADNVRPGDGRRPGGADGRRPAAVAAVEPRAEAAARSPARAVSVRPVSVELSRATETQVTGGRCPNPSRHLLRIGKSRESELIGRRPVSGDRPHPAVNRTPRPSRHQRCRSAGISQMVAG